MASTRLCHEPVQPPVSVVPYDLPGRLLTLGGGFLAFGIGVWATRHQPRPIQTVALAAIVLAAALNLIDFAATGTVRVGPLDWLLCPQRPTWDVCPGSSPPERGCRPFF